MMFGTPALKRGEGGVQSPPFTNTDYVPSFLPVQLKQKPFFHHDVRLQRLHERSLVRNFQAWAAASSSDD
jgi:hypothetical protein